MSYLMVILLSIVTPAAMAGLFRMESITSYSEFKGDDFNDENPLFESVIANYTSTDERFNFSSNVRLWHNGDRNEDEFNLYTFYANYWIVPKETRIEFGRTFQTFMTVRPRLLDMLSIEQYTLNRHLRFGGFYGIERSAEKLNSYMAESYGAQIGYVSQEIFPFDANFRMDTQRFDSKARNRGRISFRKPLLMPSSPELMADFERDFDFDSWSRSEVGVDLYPTIKSQISLRHQRYNIEPIFGADEPILNIFTSGTTEETGLRLGYVFSEKFYTSYYFGMNTYYTTPNISTTGYRHGFDLNGQIYIIRSALSFYRIDSLGGEVEGVRGSINIELRSDLEIFARTELSRYKKITSSERSALNNVLGLSYWPQKQTRVDISGEKNSNNAHRRDDRFLVQLTYLMWKET